MYKVADVNCKLSKSNQSPIFQI